MTSGETSVESQGDKEGPGNESHGIINEKESGDESFVADESDSEDSSDRDQEKQKKSNQNK